MLGCMKEIAARLALRSLAVSCLLAWACGARAQVASAAPDGKSLYAACVVCHQPNAGGSPDGIIPSLAGQRRDYLIAQLGAFGARERRAPGMDVVAAHTTFRDHDRMRTLAGYLAALPPNPDPVRGPAESVAAGASVYRGRCALCHGAQGHGGGRDVPVLACQHYPYLRRQLDVLPAVHGKLAPRTLGTATQTLSPEFKDALAAYIAHLCPEHP